MINYIWWNSLYRKNRLMANILAVVGEDMIIDTDPLCDWNNTVQGFSKYLCAKSSMQAILQIISITSVKCGWIR